MCGRYSLTDTKRVKSRFLIDEAQAEFEPNDNIAPGDVAGVVKRESVNQLQQMQWGLIPSWAREFKMTYSTFNARIEGLTKSRLYNPLLTKKRCLVPANGFYEWAEVERGQKQKFLVEVENQPLFAMAGIYDVWLDEAKVKHFSYTIVTREANPLMKRIHDRMPVIFNPKHEQEWLDSELKDQKMVMRLLDKQQMAMRFDQAD